MIKINAKKAYEATMKARPYNAAKREILRATQKGKVSVTLEGLPWDVREFLKQEGYKLESHGYHSWKVSWDKTYRRRCWDYVRGSKG